MTLKYAPDNSWYILTINEVFELGGSLVREGVAHNLMRLLAEGALCLLLIISVYFTHRSNDCLDLSFNSDFVCGPL